LATNLTATHVSNIENKAELNMFLFLKV